MRLKMRTKLILSYCLVASIPLLGILALPAFSEKLLRDRTYAQLEQVSSDYYDFVESKRAMCQRLAEEIVADATFQRLLNHPDRGQEMNDYLSPLLKPRGVEGFIYDATREEYFLSTLPESPAGASKFLKKGWIGNSNQYVTFGKAAWRAGDRFLGGVFIYYPMLVEWSVAVGDPTLKAGPVLRMEPAALLALRGYSSAWMEITLMQVVSAGDEDARAEAVASDVSSASRVYERYKPATFHPAPLSATEVAAGRVKHPILARYIPLVTVDDEFFAIVIAGMPLTNLQAIYRQTTVACCLFPASRRWSRCWRNVFFRSISRRIGLLVRGARRISEGSLDVTIHDPGQDELAVLASTFNTMARRLESTMAEIRHRTSLIEEKNRLLDLTVTELTHVREFIENVLSQVGSGVLTVNSAGRITQINPACLSIFAATEPVSELLGEPIERLLSAGPLRERIHGLLLHPECISHWETTQMVAGRPVPLEVSNSPLEIKEKKQGLVVTVRDLSVIRVLEESVRRSDKLAALGHLSAGMAHEIRNPLGIIKGSAELLEKRLSRDEEARDLARYIIDECLRLSRTLQDFLDFARPREPALDAASINQVLQKTLPLADHHPLRDKIRLELDLSPDLPDVLADAAQCQQVFLNLLLNAFEASPDGGVVQVTSRLDAERDQVVVSVQDHGVGIPTEALDNIFNPFFTTKTNGTGLGLSIVHRIMESHHGDIRVESRPGAGATFTLRFPVSPARERIART
ncbi:HAMP domain-containing protein [bacterium]|nr:HAMP domain-containing protein [bacterium]